MRSPAATLLVALATGACTGESDHHVRWTLLAPLPEGAELEADSVTVPEGETIAARPTIVEEGGSEVACAPWVTSDDPDVLFVEQAERGAFALSGKKAGETVLTVVCGTHDLDLGGRVTAVE